MNLIQNKIDVFHLENTSSYIIALILNDIFHISVLKYIKHNRYLIGK